MTIQLVGETIDRRRAYLWGTRPVIAAFCAAARSLGWSGVGGQVST
jgi:hypothetical protein